MSEPLSEEEIARIEAYEAEIEWCAWKPRVVAKRGAPAPDERCTGFPGCSQCQTKEHLHILLVEVRRLRFLEASAPTLSAVLVRDARARALADAAAVCEAVYRERLGMADWQGDSAASEIRDRIRALIPTDDAEGE